MSVLKHIRNMFGLRVLSLVITLLSIIYFTRQFPPAELGQYFYFESLLGMIGLAAGLGISGATEKYVSEGENQSLWYSTSIALLLVFGLVAVAGFTAVNLFVYEFLPPKFLGYFVIAVFVDRLLSHYKSIFRAELDATLAGQVNFAHSVVFVGSALIFLEYGYAAEGLIASAVLSRGVLLPVAVFSTGLSFTRPTISAALDLIHFGKYFAINALGGKVFYYFDVILIGVFLSNALVGQYEVAWRVVMAGMVLNGVIANTVFSYISLSHGEGNFEAVEKNIQKTLKYILIIPLGTLAGALVVGNDLLSLLFTTTYVVEPMLIGVLALGFAFQTLYYLFSKSMFAIDEPQLAFVVTLVAIVSNLSLNLFLIPTFGVIGAAVATSGSYLIAAVGYYWLLSRFVTFEFPFYRLAIQSAAAIVMGLILNGLKTSVGDFSAIATILFVGVGGAMYFIFLGLNGDVRQDIRELVSI